MKTVVQIRVEVWNKIVERIIYSESPIIDLEPNFGLENGRGVV